MICFITLSKQFKQYWHLVNQKIIKYKTYNWFISNFAILYVLYESVLLLPLRSFVYILPAQIVQYFLKMYVGISNQFSTSIYTHAQHTQRYIKKKTIYPKYLHNIYIYVYYVAAITLRVSHTQTFIDIMQGIMLYTYILYSKY